MENTFNNSVNLNPNQKLTDANDFVFHNNQEFVNFQKQFVNVAMASDQPIILDENCGCEDEAPKFYPGKLCKQIKLTFMYSDSPYTIINNKAFYWEGFERVVIQGARSAHSSSHDIPVIELHNEMATDAQKYKISEGVYFHSYDNDDAIFNIQNEHICPADIVVSDIAFRVAFNLDDVEGAKLYERWYHPEICPVFFKVYEANSFKMYNVRMYSQYLDFTHVFLHWCENVEITNCEFKNYNARRIGGNIWMCQRVKNVNIVNNDFYKYGNDENIGIWGDSLMNREENNLYKSKETLLGLDDDAFANRQLDFEHIHIKNNRFFYGKPQSHNDSDVVFPNNIKLDAIHKFQKTKYQIKDEDKEKEWEGVIDVFQNLYFSQHTQMDKIRFFKGGTPISPSEGMDFQLKMANDDNLISDEVTEPAIVPYVHYKVSNYVIDGNEFYIDAPMNVLMGITCDNYCRTEDIKITNNLIKYGAWAHQGCQLQDFKIIYDKNLDNKTTGYGLAMTNKKCLNPILIEGNTIESVAYPFIVYKDETEANEYHIVLNVENASVAFNRNTVDENIKGVKGTIDSGNVIDNITVHSVSDDLGYMLLYSRDKGGRVTMLDNVFTGMCFMGSFVMDKAAMPGEVELTATDNVFQGGTTFYSKNLQDGIFKFTNNLFFAEKFVVILQEMPKKTQLVLRDNVIKRVLETESDGAYANLYYSNLFEGDESLPLPDQMTVVSSGNKFENIKGEICPKYEGLNVQVFTSNEFPIDSKFVNN